MQSPDKQALYAAAHKLQSALAALPGLEDLTSDLEVTSPQVDVEIDRDKAAALGVTANQIESAFYDAYGPRWVSTIYGPVNEYKVLLELEPQFQADPQRAVAALLQGAAARDQPGGPARHARDAARSRSARRRSTTTGSCRPSRSRSGWRRAPRSATCSSRVRQVDDGHRARGRQRASSRARPRRSRVRCRTSRCCWSSPSWSSTSCSAFCTRATSTR